MIDPRTLYETPSWLLALVLLAILPIAIDTGFRLGRRKRASGVTSGVGTLEAVVYGLFGLLLALTFSTVVSRADQRRAQVVEEVNAIGTAYLRADIAPEQLREELRAKMRAYVDVRVELALSTASDERAAVARGQTLQREIWSTAVAFVRDHPQGAAYALIIEALNDMFDAQTSLDTALFAHVPTLVLLFLGLTAAVTAVVAGYALGFAGDRHVMATACFVILTTLVAYMIIDLDRPRRGLFRVPVKALLELQQSLRGGQ